MIANTCALSYAKGERRRASRSGIRTGATATAFHGSFYRTTRSVTELHLRLRTRSGAATAKLAGTHHTELRAARKLVRRKTPKVSMPPPTTEEMMSPRKRFSASLQSIAINGNVLLLCLYWPNIEHIPIAEAGGGVQCFRDEVPR
jgi:hypothetical protein